MNWVVGHNLPGYLPESDPIDNVDWEEAMHTLHEEVDRSFNHTAEFYSNLPASLAKDRVLADLEAEAAQFESSWQQYLDKGEEQGLTFAVLSEVYWVQPRTEGDSR